MSKPRYSSGEEIANSVTHGVGMILSIGGLVVLAVFAVSLGDTWHVVSTSIFGVTLILLYASSTLYHSIQIPHVKRILRIIDLIIVNFTAKATSSETSTLTSFNEKLLCLPDRQLF